MRRRYDLERSDNLPYAGRKAYTCSGSGFIDIETRFPVRAATITWSSLPTYDAPFEMSSSSSSTSSSSSLDSSSSSSSSSQSSSSSTSLSSSSSSDSSQSSESIGNNSSSSTSSSESSGGFDDYYCMIGSFSDTSINGTYYKNGAYNKGKPIYTNGTYLLYYHTYSPTWDQWVVDTIVADGNLGIAFSDTSHGEFPSSQQFDETANPSNTGYAFAGECSSNSSSSSGYSSSESSTSSESMGNNSSSSSSLSETSEIFPIAYCFGSEPWAGAGLAGSYVKTDQYINDRPVFSRQDNFDEDLYMFFDNIGGIWQISNVASTSSTIIAEQQTNVFDNQLPNDEAFDVLPYLVPPATPAVGPCSPLSTSSSSESSSSSSTSNTYYGSFKVPRIYIWSYLSNGFRVRYENIPEEVGFVEFAYLAF